ncbi:MAG: DUF2064 domain-containing protein [Ignavibacteriae bacterium]|nr:DUF2064 domain-containing protein [Ignavibacteriota bacterium]MCB9215144.1 DUF2064 domain-containing protein [Ignavibacteria bacterium]
MLQIATTIQERGKRRESRNALLFFIRDERSEAQLKPLPAKAVGGGPQAYRRLNQLLLSRLRGLQRKGIDVIVVSASHSSPTETLPLIVQRGESFGERITNGAADAFQLGYQNVVIVGNDCPDISPNDVSRAIDLLKGGTSYVGGPTKDGGAFLVGLRHDSNSTLFRELSWQTPRLFSELTSLPNAQTLDITREDFDSWLAPEALRALTKLFRFALRCAGAHTYSQQHELTRTRRKALTRSFLSSPPLF